MAIWNAGLDRSRAKALVLGWILALVFAAPSFAQTAGQSYQRAMAYWTGRGISKDPAKAFQWLHRARSKGSVPALYALGRAYAQGYGTSRSYPKAAKAFALGAKQGHAASQFGLALSYAKGRGVAKDLAKAKLWAQRAARGGSAKAARFLKQLEAGTPAESFDLLEALEETSAELAEVWTQGAHDDILVASRKAAQAGSVLHSFFLGLAYEKGILVEPEAKQAREWYQASAQYGSPQAARRLADMLRASGKPSDWERALPWYQMAVEGRDTLAMRTLAFAHAKKLFSAADPQQAGPLLERAARDGAAYDSYLSGLHFAQGVLVKKDPAKAESLLRAALPWVEADVQARIASMFLRGDGVEVEANLGRRWLERAAKAGVTEAKDLLSGRRQTLKVELASAYEGLSDALGRYLIQVNQVLQRAAATLGSDRAEAEEIFTQGITQTLQTLGTLDLARDLPSLQKKAKAGELEAELTLAVLHLIGFGVEKDVAEGRRLLEVAVAKKSPQAMYMVAQLYQFGYGVSVDYRKSAEWYLKSSQAGHENATLQLANCYLFGLGVRQDGARGERLLRVLGKKASQGLRYAISMFFQAGFGVPQDVGFGKEILEDLASMGNAMAQRALEGYPKDADQVVHGD